MSEKYEMLDHEADIKFKVVGTTLDEVFENSALALSNYISAGEKIKSIKGKTIEVKGEDIKSLLYNFLDEIIYLLDAESFMVTKASVFLRGNNLKAEVYGDEVKKQTLQQVKAATYSEMEITKTKSGWQAIFVMDV